METPFSTTRTVLFSMLERGSFFLPFIFAYIPWLNLVIIPTTKHLLRKEREREREREREKRKRVATMNLTKTYSFSPQFL